MIAAEIESVTVKIDALEVIRRRLEGSMIKMQEEELELEDEREYRCRARAGLVHSTVAVSDDQDYLY